MISRDTKQNQWTGLSTDDWTMANPIFKDKITNGDVGFEMDTKKPKMWDAQNSLWISLK